MGSRVWEETPHRLPLPSGGFVDFAEPECSVIDITDIANGLATKYRFAGMTERWYTVAQHSVVLSRLVSPSLAMQALLHDAGEAFTADLVKPLKSLCSDFAAIEERICRAIFRKFGLAWPIDPEVHTWDKRLARRESRMLRGWLVHNTETDTVPISDEHFCTRWAGWDGLTWAPHISAMEFFRRFQHLKVVAADPEESRHGH